ncbi:1-acylglycerol-3-phosphate O-acyltransferase [Gordonia soli NBRC 108243]|uniref:1-acylglycerol-3-phosphate O-acyltransferase n=1 Tax=Gordonia soli NBRC 108243 TaxID=1223545 RepID=M0QCT4_9ACTN|nr:1-acylglycerol-3-phosphate O-acyltransferase [Gordonia soli NBRC 108243]
MPPTQSGAAALLAPDHRGPAVALVPPLPVEPDHRPEPRACGPDQHSWYPLSPCGADCLPGDHRGVGRVLVAYRITRLLGVAAAVILGGLMVMPAPRVVRRRYLRRAARALLSAIGVSVYIDDDRPFPGSARGLVVANHVSYLDILAIAMVNPAHFVAKSDVASMPVIATLANRLGVITVDRGSLRALPDILATTVEKLHRDSSVAVFPEGTTWCGRRSGSFRPAFFQAAVDAGVPVLPIRVRYTGPDGALTTAPGFIGDDGPADTLRRVLRMRGLTVQVRVHELQLPAADRRELSRRCEALIAQG